VADRCLVGLALGRAATQQRGERAQSVRLVHVAPQLSEFGCEGVERRPDRLDRQRERRLDERQPAAPGQRHVGHQRGGAGRSVDQRHLFPRFELDALGQLAEQMAEGQDLARAAVAPSGHGRQRTAVKHGRHSGGHQRPRARVTLDEVGQTGEHDGAHDPLWQRLPE
jgi:hypothetical protein